MKKLVVLTLFVGLAYYAYGEFVQNPLIGKWDLDSDTTVAKLKETGASKHVINDYIYKAELNKSYLYVTSQDMEISQFGEHLKVKYQIQSRNKNCLNILWDGDEKPSTLCVSGDKLEWRDENNSPLGFYRKRK